MKAHRFFFFVLLAGSLAVLGCGGGDNGDNGGDGGTAGSGGAAGTGGSAGTGGTGGSVSIASGLYSSWAVGTAVCLVVNEDATKLVAPTDGSCAGAFWFTTNRQDGICGFSYPQGEELAEVAIVDNKFEVERTRTDLDGEYTIRFSGEFNANGGVAGVASSTRNCPMDQSWSAREGCCTICDWCQ